MTVLELPDLGGWLADAAGILPLSALIEFTDVAIKIHSYELSGRGLLWNWLVSPISARLLFSINDGSNTCCLDRAERTPPLHCIDGRWGALYPAHSPFTIRACVSQTNQSFRGVKHTNDTVSGFRRQRLEVVRVLLEKIETEGRFGSDAEVENVGGSNRNPQRFLSLTHILRQIDKHGRGWFSIMLIGWLLWFLVLVMSLLAGLYLAVSYLVTLALTGLVIRYSHGHKARKLLDRGPSEFSRMVVLCDSLNGNNWVVFIGGHRAVDSLLNKPLYKSKPVPVPRVLRGLSRLLVAAQWGLTVAACALQDWNALVISVWIAVCACTSTYIYTERSSVQGWLKSNQVVLEKAEVTFGTRQAMLSALVALNPDRKNMKWINPILEPSEDRKKWEEALLEKLETGRFIASSLGIYRELTSGFWILGTCHDNDTQQQYWWQFIEEGVDVVKDLDGWLQGLGKKEV